MLQELRAKTHGLVAKILLGLIVITFSFFGVESYFIGQTVDFVAKVGDREISQQDFRTRFDEFRQRQLEAANGAIDAKFFEQPAIKRRILDQLIDEQVLLVANEELGIAVPAQRLREEILKIPAFQRDGNFDAALYRARLSAQGMTPKAFDERIARDLATREIPMGVAMSTFVTDEEINSYLRLRGQLRDIRYVTLAKPELADVKVSEEEIAAFYTEHQQDFMNPEQVALDYIEVDAAKLDVNLTPDESTLKDRYEKEKSRFVTSEQRLASHILIKVAGSGGPEEQKKALEKARKIADEARAGKDFAELAKASSEDLGSRALGGDLGWLDKGMTDPAFEGALYSLEKGKISDPVLSPEGYHVIEVREIRPGKTRTFEEVRGELANDFGESERERVYNERSGRLIDLTYEDSTSLEPAAKELGLRSRRQRCSHAWAEPALRKIPRLSGGVLGSGAGQGNNSDKVSWVPTISPSSA
ncbi:MAG: SurA N-terminal domain-containing protein [Xanthomonadales bacterium]|nr:SurA N-terminal domain-containing protein [Xanthomonadales bacterium]